jgi:Tol biopolymer transport system component
MMEIKKLRGITILLFCFFPTFSQAQQIESSLEIIDISTKKRKIILEETRHFEAPNWSRDGKFFLINSLGKLEKISLKGKKLGIVNTGFANSCNNDHGYSFDGKLLIISHNDTTVGKQLNSRIFTLPAQGGTPKLITMGFPSYWHGISPDGKTLIYCAMRNNTWDIYSIPVEGGEETRLTTAEGLDDGCEYSPDGKYIYFNSFRTGKMQIWRMKADGSEQIQLTFDEYSNWFPHLSPNGKWLVYIAYLQDQKGSHPFGKEVKLRLMNLETMQTSDLTDVFCGGQGSINVPSWSPDSKKLAFVSYKIQPSKK